ncbi:MAG TPA: sugar phosphate nucleotidyltransferase, partial [Azospira sp.]|nr:sugar phosphate nucleotidyltransferase [Azospira sp.]
MNIHPVILCGGAGTRLWPLSRESNPKQFLPLLRGESPFAATLGRLRGLDCAEPLIVTQSEHLFRVREQVRQAGLTEGPVHLEPFGRGTAPAVAIAAYRLLDQDPQAAVLVLPSDHDIPDPAAFQEAVTVGIQALEQGRLVVFGLTAQSPETGFGYMEQGAELAEAPGCHQVLRFIEKPEIEIARGLVASGRHHWNSGIFLFGAAAFLAEMERLEPELAAACRQVADGGRLDGQAFAINPDQFARCRNVSVDHAILERTGLTAMVPAHFPWSDMGTWDALWAAADKDGQGNSAHGDVQLHGVSNSYVHA